MNDSPCFHSVRLNRVTA